MKSSCLCLLTLLCLVAIAQCYGGRGYDPLGELIKARRLKKPANYENDKDSANQDLHYSPVYVSPQDGLKEADKITTLPGQPNGVNFDQYSGYVTVDPKAGRALFYYLAESVNSSSTKPLVLWLNGGPGCSSFGNGAMTELGPFRVNPDGKTLWYNKYAWNNEANILFLESPAGVGFSYSNTTSDYITGDTKTAADSYTFLINWLERFPEYKTRDFYMTGESYAGHYVPQLAKLILDYNKKTNQTVINLKGIAIGNAYVDYETENTGMYDYFWTHALISDEIHDQIVSSCNFSSEATVSETCQNYTDQADAIKGDVFIYNIYEPWCSDPSSNNTPISGTGFDPCSGDYVYTYLNAAEVQKSLHANTTGIPGSWDSCNGFIFANWNDKPDTVLPTIKELTESGLSVWIYSGDTDGRVPVTTTRYGINELGLSVKTPWYAWYNENEVGGYVVEYQNMTFVTIRGAGHFVPSYQPARALAFFSAFLEGKLPASDQN